MHRPPIPHGHRWHRAVVAVLLVVGVVLMVGPPASTAAVASGPTSGMETMEGMSAADVLPRAGTAPDGATVTHCAAMCGDVLEACLAALTLLVAAAMALPGLRRLVRSRSWPLAAGRARWWVVGESPPWPAPSLARLSVLRV